MGLRDFFIKRKPDRVDTDEPISPVYVISGQPVRYLSAAAVMTAEQAQRKSPQLYRITNYISSAVQSVPWYVEKDPNEAPSNQPGEQSSSRIKALNELLKYPNDSFTAPQLRYWLTLNLMLYARAHFKVGVTSNGTPNGIYPLAAKYVKGILNTRGIVDSYEYGQGDSKVTYPTRRAADRMPGKPAYASEISFPSLTGLVEYNKAPAAIESIAMPIAIIHALMQRALDTAAGHPNVKYIITADKTLTKAQKDALKSHLEQAAAGEEGSGEVLFLYNTEIKVHKLDNELSDIHSKIPMDDMTRQVAGVFGIPISLLGLGSADAAKYASNYMESRLSFWQDTIVPCYLVPIATAMTAAICPPGARVCFDLDAIPALWEGRANLGERLSKVTCLTTSEKREILGFGPTDIIPEYIEPRSPTASGPSGPHPLPPPVPDPRDPEDYSRSLQ